MSGVATAIGGGAVLGAIVNSNSASSAASAQEAAANAANATSWAEFQQQQQNQAPFLRAGQQAVGDLSSDMPNLTRQFTMADFQQDPGYQFNLQQGQQALQRSAAARGLLNSTGTMRDMLGYSQGMASNEYQNAYNRLTQNQQQNYNMLAGLAGTGQVATGQLGQAGMNAANNMSANTIGAGNAAAAATIGQGNAMSGMIGNVANAGMNYAMMSNMNNPYAGGVGSPSGYMAEQGAGSGNYFDTGVFGPDGV